MSFVACPHCGTSVDETALRCPACHADLATTMRIPRQQGTWCVSCGALVPEGASACPSCGLPVDGTSHVHGTAHDSSSPSVPDEPSVPADEAPLPDDTQTIARIESALPAEPVERANVRDADAPPQTPQVLAFVTIAVLAVVITAAVITHPWDPDAYSISTTTGTDTSKVGFPGEMKTLSSQDRSAVVEGSETADEAAYRTLKACWDSLGSLRDDLSSSEELVRDVADGKLTFDDAAAAASAADQTTVELSSVISDVEDAVIDSDAYIGVRAHMVTLGNWLRNWSDTIAEAWDRAEAAGYVADSSICLPLDAVAPDDRTNPYCALFDESYASWEPLPPPR